MLAHIRKLIFIAFTLLCFALSASSEVPVITDEVKARVEENIKKFKVPENIKQRALELKKHTESEQYQEKQREYEKRIASIIGLDNKDSEQEETENSYNKLDRFILFVSSSIPEATLRRYAKQIEKVDGLMVLRGTVDNQRKLMPTLQFMERILKVDPLCDLQPCKYIKANVTIDPRLFEANNIQQVPALIFVEDMDMANYIDKRNGNGIPDKSTAIVYGDANLKGMANELYRLTKNPRLKPHLKRL